MCGLGTPVALRTSEGQAASWAFGFRGMAAVQQMPQPSRPTAAAKRASNAVNEPPSQMEVFEEMPCRAFIAFSCEGRQKGVRLIEEEPEVPLVYGGLGGVAEGRKWQPKIQAYGCRLHRNEVSIGGACLVQGPSGSGWRLAALVCERLNFGELACSLE